MSNNSEEPKAGKVVREKNFFKAALLQNLCVFLISLSFLSSKYVYLNHPTLQPPVLLFLRGLISTLYQVILVNKRLKAVMWDDVPSHMVPSLVKRALQASAVILI